GVGRDMRRGRFATVAGETGGGFREIRIGQDLGAAFADIADELHSQYLLGFAPPKRDGKTHRISVRLGKAGLKARSRKSGSPMSSPDATRPIGAPATGSLRSV